MPQWHKTGHRGRCPVLFLLLVLPWTVTVQGQAIPDSAADVDAYLVQSESAYSDIVPGTEKRVVWAGDAGRRTPLAFVYLHGFSGSSRETAPFADRLAARFAANLYYPRLTGHGRSEAAMLEGSAELWLADAEQALQIGRLLGDRVIVIGVSTGATLATWLAAQDTDEIEALILMSPNYAVADWRAGLLRWAPARWLLKQLYGEIYRFEPVNELHARYWTESYAVDALAELIELLHRVEQVDVAAIHVPLLLFYAQGDKVVDVPSILATFARWGGAGQSWLVRVEGADDPSQHVLAGDILSPSVTEQTVELSAQFLQALDLRPVSP